MKKFNFKFETVLKQRKMREEEALRVFGKAQRDLQTQKDELVALRESLEGALVRRESLGSQAVAVHEFQLEENFIRGIKIRISKVELAIQRVSKSVEKALRVYLQARKQSRAIEILREKAYQEYRQERVKYEQKILDDITVMRAGMKEDLI